MAELQKAPWSDWETVRLIGRGSFGTVYEIHRKLVDEDTEAAALKVITIPQNPGDIEEMYSEGYDNESVTATFNAHLKSIVAEYSLMRKMDGSANIVNCKDIRYIQHDDGVGWDIYIRMELLTPLLKALPVDADKDAVIKIGKDICNALVLCKKHGIVHRDIKPQNIFVSPNGDYKLGDFGIAKTVEKTMGGTKIGTYKYMAPEVYNNQPYGSAADIYSLGLVLYWLLNERRMPFMPRSSAPIKMGQDEEARHRRLSGEKLPEPAHGSAALKRIVLKACAYDPKDRYESAAAMLEDLNRLEGGVVPVVNTVAAKNHTESYEDDKTTGPVFGSVQNISTTFQTETDATVGPRFDVNATSGIKQQEPEMPCVNAKTLLSNKRNTGKIRRWLILILMVVVYASCFESFVERIITGNIMIASQCENLRESINEINSVLVEWIGATTNAHGIVSTRFGMILFPSINASALANARYLIFSSVLLLLFPIAVAIWYAIRIMQNKKMGINHWGVRGKIIILGIIVALYLAAGDTFLSRIITGNIMLGAQYENVREPIKVINDILQGWIGATTNAHGIVSTRFGITLNPAIDTTSLQNACYLILPALLVHILPLVLWTIEIRKCFTNSNRSSAKE